MLNTDCKHVSMVITGRQICWSMPLSSLQMITFLCELLSLIFQARTPKIASTNVAYSVFWISSTSISVWLVSLGSSKLHSLVLNEVLGRTENTWEFKCKNNFTLSALSFPYVLFGTNVFNDVTASHQCFSVGRFKLGSWEFLVWLCDRFDVVRKLRTRDCTDWTGEGAFMIVFA